MELDDNARLIYKPVNGSPHESHSSPDSHSSHSMDSSSGDSHSSADSHSVDLTPKHTLESHAPDGHSTGGYNGHGTLHGGSSETFLLAGLTTDSAGPFIFACLVLALIAFVMEVARYYTCKLEKKMQKLHDEKLNLVTTYQTSYPAVQINVDNDDRKLVDKNLEVTPQAVQTTSVEPELEERTSFLRELKSWLCVAALYSSSYLVSLLLMLIAMTYNVYLILSVCLGVTLGKLFVLYLKYRKR